MLQDYLLISYLRYKSSLNHNITAYPVYSLIFLFSFRFEEDVILVT